MPSITAPSITSRSRYWRSLDELADTPEYRAYVEREFPAAQDETLTSESRRRFLKIMGASAALAGLTACRWPKETIVPFAHRPEDRVPGEPDVYATAFELGGAASGLLVTSYDGRPTKIEGNPNHPESLGATSAIDQALVLDLYDPDRSEAIVERNGNAEYQRSWDEFRTAAGPLFANLRASRGAGLAILARPSSSPGVAALKGRVRQALPDAAWHEYEAVSRDAERLGTKLAFGRAYRPQPRLADADVIVSLDDNFLVDHPAALRLAREFSARRRPDENVEMNRLLVVESAMTPTGAMADERFAVAHAAVPVVALRLAAALGVAGVPADWTAQANAHPLKADFVSLLAKELNAHRGRSLVLAGPGQPPEVHAIVHLVNAALGNAGKTVRYAVDPEGDRPAHADDLAALVGAMKGGRVDTLLVLGANPAYDAPAELDFAGALKSVKHAVHLGVQRDETAHLCAWHVPQAHPLESWGDVRAWDGTVSVVQPLIEPLFGGKTVTEMLAFVLGDGPQTAHEIAKATFAALSNADARAWRAALNAGVVPDTAWPVEAPAPNAAALAGRALKLAPPTGPGALELVFLRDPKVHDGRFANNAWLQEMPDPITRIVWDNPLLVSPELAQRLGVGDESVVRVTVGRRTLDVAVAVIPGMPSWTVGLALGYGRTSAGAVGDNTGFDAYRLRESGTPWSASNVGLEKTAGTYTLASTQNFWAIDTTGKEERARRAPELVRTGTLAEFRHDPKFAKEGEGELYALWQEFKYEGHAWAMAVDLSACVGCGACTVACQSENNIPVVGKDQVKRGRHMNWLRIDRYFAGKPEAPAGVVFQPVACVHCENAPCEQVCPVGATVHSRDGLNQMVYNRCVGTRYCSNNCPYKVRRFNFYNYNAKLTELQMMQKNPDVTVRQRGVMEKCTYCTQRIERVRIRAKNERRPIKDGEIVTACAQACPTQAIVFGDLNDEGSRVRALHTKDRAYALLGDLNTKPRTHYLARISNPAEGAERPAGGEA